MAKKKQTKDGKEAAPAKTEIAIHCKYDKLVDPKKLKPHPANPWKHPDSQIDLLAKIMAKPDIGIRHEIIVSKTSGFIVEGHCRREAAIKLNIKEYPVVYQEFETEATERAVMLNDNKIAEFAEVDGLIMADNLVELDQLNYPLEFTAMNEDEIQQYIFGPTIVPMPDLPSGDKSPFQQMTFTLHDSQVESIIKAVKKAKQENDFSKSQNENSNGNALFAIAEFYNEQS